MTQPVPISFANDHLLTKDQKEFCWNTLEYLHRCPRACTIPLLPGVMHQPTVDAIKYIIDSEMDIMCGFVVEFDKLPDATKVKKYPSLKKYQPKPCMIEINNILLRSDSPKIGSSTNTDNDMAEKTPRTRKPKAGDTTALVTPVTSETLMNTVTIATPAVLTQGTVDAAFIAGKTKVEAAVAKIKKFKAVTSEEEAAGITEALKELRTVFKIIETVHKDGKDPYWDMCKKYDAAKKPIADLVTEWENYSKDLLMDFQQVQRQKQEEIARKAELDRLALEKAGQDEAARISNIKVQLDAFEKELSTAIIAATGFTELTKVYNEKWLPFVPSEEAHGPFFQYATEMKARLHSLGIAKNQIFQAEADLKATPPKLSVQAADQIKEQANERIRAYAFQYNNAVIQAHDIQQVAQEELTIATETAKMEITGNQIAQQTCPVIPTRKSWRFEVVDWKTALTHALNTLIENEAKGIMNTPPAFVMINEQTVIEFAKREGSLQEDPLQNGEIINGIAFYIHETPIAPSVKI